MLDPAGLRAISALITDHYNRNGFFVAQAYLPAQQLVDGHVTITLIKAATTGCAAQHEPSVGPDRPSGTGWSL